MPQDGVAVRRVDEADVEHARVVDEEKVLVLRFKGDARAAETGLMLGPLVSRDEDVHHVREPAGASKPYHDKRLAKQQSWCRTLTWWHAPHASMHETQILVGLPRHLTISPVASPQSTHTAQSWHSSPVSVGIGLVKIHWRPLPGISRSSMQSSAF